MDTLGLLTKKLVTGFSEEEELIVAESAELWVDVLNEVIIVLSVDHEVEHWLEITLADSDEVEVESMEGLEGDWHMFWVKPLLVFFGHVDGLQHSLDKGSLVMYDNLVLVLVGDLSPVLLDSSELTGVSDSSDLSSESDNLWDLVHGVVLHLSELVVLLVEDNPLISVNVDGESGVWLLTSPFAVLSGGSLESHMGSLDLVHLGHVDFLELLDLWGWASLVHGLDEFTDGLDLMGGGKGMDLTLELFAVSRFLHLHLVDLGLMLESFAVLLKSLKFLLLHSDLEEFSGLLEVGRSGGGDSGDSGELVHWC